MVSYNTFKFCFELECDLFRYLQVLRNNGVKLFRVIPNYGMIGGDCEISTNVSLTELIQLTKQCVDCHYIEETINFINDYTGERTYQDRI